MLTWALCENGEIVIAERARKEACYFCPECFERVVLNGENSCFLHDISSCHISRRADQYYIIQKHIVQSLGDRCVCESYFPNIPSIASVVLPDQKIVIEIQTDLAFGLDRRSRKYEQAGWRPVWLLHADTFGFCDAHHCEEELSRWPHYFTDYDQERGDIWDEMSWVSAGQRHWWQWPSRRKLSIRSIQRREVCNVQGPSWYVDRSKTWGCHIVGDCISSPPKKTVSRTLFMNSLTTQLRLIWAVCIR